HDREAQRVELAAGDAAHRAARPAARRAGARRRRAGRGGRAGPGAARRAARAGARDAADRGDLAHAGTVPLVLATIGVGGADLGDAGAAARGELGARRADGVSACLGVGGHPRSLPADVAGGDAELYEVALGGVHLGAGAAYGAGCVGAEGGTEGVARELAAPG